MGLPIWVLIAAFSAMLCWAFGDFLIQRSTRKIGDLESLAFIGVIGTIGLIPLMIKDFGLIFTTSNLILLLVLGIVTFIAAIFDFEALRIAKLSTVDVILELELPITIALGYFFFSEGLSAIQFVIIALIFVGILLVATESFAHWKIRWEKGVFLALLAALGMGLINFLTSASSRSISPIMAVWGPWFVFTIFCLVLIYKRGDFPKFIRNASRYKWLVLGMGILDTAAWIFYAFAISYENVGLITAITESYPAVAVFLAVWINKERINWHQYLGAILAIVASVTLVLLI